MPISTDPKPSDAIAARNRANARHSTGPRTAAGKAAGSRNAVTHGLRSSHPLAVGAPAQAAARRVARGGPHGTARCRLRRCTGRHVRSPTPCA